MPCVAENGLLPGRGPEGLGALVVVAGVAGGVAAVAAGAPPVTSNSGGWTVVGPVGMTAGGVTTPLSGRGPGRGPALTLISGSADAASGETVEGAPLDGDEAAALAGAALDDFLAALVAAAAFQASP